MISIQKVNVDGYNFKTYTAENLSEYNPICVFFATNMCYECRVHHKNLERYAYQRDDIYYGIVWCDEQPNLCRQLNITQFPTLKIRQGKHWYQFHGEHNYDNYIDFLDRYTRTVFIQSTSMEDLEKKAYAKLQSTYFVVKAPEEKHNYFEMQFFPFRRHMKAGYFAQNELDFYVVRNGIKFQYDVKEMDNELAINQFVFRHSLPLMQKFQLKHIDSKILNGYQRIFLIVFNKMLIQFHKKEIQELIYDNFVNKKLDNVYLGYIDENDKLLQEKIPLFNDVQSDIKQSPIENQLNFAVVEIRDENFKIENKKLSYNVYKVQKENVSAFVNSVLQNNEATYNQFKINKDWVDFSITKEDLIEEQ